MTALDNECEIKKEDALDILDRTIGFVNNCDNKTAIFLGIFGVIVTVIFSTDGINNISGIISRATLDISFCAIAYLTLWAASLVTFAYGQSKFILALRAKINTADMKQADLDSDSKIFFGAIAGNGSYRAYKDKLLSIDNNALLNDIISQIYINSVICKRKFERYNKGLQLTVIGSLCFIVLWGIGNHIF